MVSIIQQEFVYLKVPVKMIMSRASDTFGKYWLTACLSYSTLGTIFLTIANKISVRYHTGGSIKINARILHLAHMVYLKPKHNLLLAQYIHN
jgi:hypothetical protein